MFKSLKTKITTAIIFVTSLCTVTFMAISYYEVRNSAITQMQNDGSTLIATINREMKEYKITETDKIGDIFQKAKAESKGNIVYLSLVDTKMKLLVKCDDNSTGTSSSGKSETSSGSEGKNGDVDGVSAASEQDGVAEVIKDEKTSGFIFKAPDGQKVYNVSTPFYENSKLVGTLNIGISLKDMYSLIMKCMLQTVAASILIQILAVGIGMFISKSIVRPIEDILGRLDSFAGGDFTVSFHTKTQDEVRRLTDGLNNSVAVLRNTIQEVKNTAMNLDNISGCLILTGEETAASGREVAGTVEEVVAGITDQSVNISEISNTFGLFSTRLDGVEDKVRDLSISSNNIMKTADVGEVNLKGLIESISDVRASFGSAVEKIENLNSEVVHIGDIVNVINGVAQKTNLLALNAAIEAARAGESGRGFAVVADEIRKLAEQVLISSKNINDIINAVMRSTGEVVVTASSITEKMDKQKDSIENTVQSFNEIQQEVESTMPGIKKVENNLKELIMDKESIIGKINSVNDIAQQISAAAEEISASVENQSGAVDNLFETVKSLDSAANSLLILVEKFKA